MSPKIEKSKKISNNLLNTHMQPEKTQNESNLTHLLEQNIHCFVAIEKLTDAIF